MNNLLKVSLLLRSAASTGNTRLTTARYGSMQAFQRKRDSFNFNTIARSFSQTPRKKVTTVDLQQFKRKGNKIVMVTAYDYPSAKHVDLAGIDVLLVGDSVAMVELGYDTTQPVTMDEMLHHCKAVARGAHRPLLVGDMPYGSYEISPSQALANAYRFIKEAGMDAVKLEGGKPRAETVRALVSGGVAVMGHVGLTPQAVSVLGGFRAQGRTAAAAAALVADARALQEAGAFCVVIECVPEVVGKMITDAIEIPTIGIGSGRHTSGQVLVYHDMLGMMQHPHHAAFVPKFCKRYADVGGVIRQGLEEFRRDVREGAFPSAVFSPYQMTKEEEKKLEELVGQHVNTDEDNKEQGQAGQHVSSPLSSDDDETIKVY